MNNKNWKFIKLNKPSPEAIENFNQMICDYIVNKMMEEQVWDGEAKTNGQKP